MNSDFCVAVHALVYLEHKKTLVSSEELAENICTNSARVRKVLSKLKKAGFVSTREGAEGGYKLEREAQKLSLSMVAAALGASFVELNWRSGSYDKPCLIASGMADLMDDMVQDLNGICQKRLDSMTISKIVDRLFKDGTKT